MQGYHDTNIKRLSQKASKRRKAGELHLYLQLRQELRQEDGKFKPVRVTNLMSHEGVWQNACGSGNLILSYLKRWAGDRF